MPKFDDHEELVQYNRVLGSGDEGVVASATIKGEEYALKFVKYHVKPPPVEPIDWIYLLYFDSDEPHRSNRSPFADGCRAFARINNKKLDGIYTCKCYGWMKIEPLNHEIWL